MPAIAADAGRNTPGVADVPDIPGYEMLGRLGRGGMGLVFRARQIALNRFVAVKMVAEGAGFDAELRRRFQSEAEAVAQLQHPNIVNIFEVGEANGQPFFSMELIEGSTLAERIRESPLPHRESAELVATLAAAIHFAHERDIIHRDLKPANILMTADGTPKITDFGLAKRTNDESSQTQTGVAIGTPSYMAPEQAEGRAHEIGPRTDVYALGTNLYETLTGRPPFQAESVIATIRQLLDQDPVSPRMLNATIPRDLETIVLKCLEKDPVKRYHTALEVSQDLHRFLDGIPIAARRTGLFERSLKWMKRRPALTAMYGVLALASVVIVVVWARSDIQVREALDKSEQQRRVAEDRLEKSLEAIDSLVEVASDQLERAPEIDDERRAILADALHSLEELLIEDQGDPRVRRRIGSVCLELSHNDRKLGDLNSAEQFARRSLQMWSQLQTEFPENLTFRDRTILSMSGLSIILAISGDSSEGIRMMRDAFERAERLSADSELYRGTLAKMAYNRGLMYFSQRDIDNARSCIKLAIKKYHELLEDDSYAKKSEALSALAAAQQTLASTYYSQAQIEPARKFFEESLATRDRLHEQDSAMARDPLSCTEEARCRSVLGEIYATLGQREEAEQFALQAYELRDQLAADYPVTSEYRDGLTGSLNQLIQYYRDRNQYDEAVRFANEKVAFFRAVAARESDNA